MREMVIKVPDYEVKRNEKYNNARYGTVNQYTGKQLYELFKAYHRVWGKDGVISRIFNTFTDFDTVTFQKNQIRIYIDYTTYSATESKLIGCYHTTYDKDIDYYYVGVSFMIPNRMSIPIEEQRQIIFDKVILFLKTQTALREEEIEKKINTVDFFTEEQNE